MSSLKNPKKIIWKSIINSFICSYLKACDFILTIGLQSVLRFWAKDEVIQIFFLANKFFCNLL